MMMPGVFLPTLDEVAAREWISLIARLTCADRLVTVNVTHGVSAARTATRAGALVTLAGQVGGAVSVDNTLGPAVGRSTDHTHSARAHGTFLNHATLRVGTARRWYARVGDRHNLWFCGQNHWGMLSVTNAFFTVTNLSN